MKVYLVVEDYDSGPGVASLNICDIFLTEERAIEKLNDLIEDEKSYYSENDPFYVNYYHIMEWEVEE